MNLLEIIRKIVLTDREYAIANNNFVRLATVSASDSCDRCHQCDNCDCDCDCLYSPCDNE